jgi:hypothetical protein
MRLYGMNRDAAAHILERRRRPYPGYLPIVRATDEAAYGGRYRSTELVVGCMNALVAGDIDSGLAV